VTTPRLGVLVTVAAAAFGHAAGAQEPRAVPKQLLRPQPQVVLSAADGSPPIGEFGLGDGGVRGARGRLRCDKPGACVTSGGVQVACLSVGVKLTFPSGRELLVAPDGALHLRSGEAAGPFGSGVELRLADESVVQVVLAQARKNRLREVSIVDGGRALQLWRRGKAAQAAARPRPWAGVRIACCGDGGDLYRPLGLGAVLVLERVLVARKRSDATPATRVVLLTRPLLESLRRMPRQHRETQRNVRQAVAAVTAVGERGDEIFRAGAALQRARRDRPRWSLAAGFELELALDGPLWPRLQLFAGRSPLPMVEWTVGAAGAAYLTNPNPDQLGKRWHGNGTRMPRVAPDLQVREHLEERQRALQLLRGLAKQRG
jgi:hypothetical protein